MANDTLSVFKPRVVFVTSHPIQYQVPVFRCLAARTDMEFIVLFALLPDAASQGAGFGVAFEWDVPLLEGYTYRVLKNVATVPSVTCYKGCDTPEIEAVLRELQIDVVIVNGWVVKTCLQALWAAKKLGIPCIVRGEANNLRKRSWWKRWLQRLLVRRYDAVLPIGKANREFYRRHGVADVKMFAAPYCVENERFARAAAEAEPRRRELRSQWSIPENAVCFLYCGKFEHKKHPVELVEAFLQAFQNVNQSAANGPPIYLLMVGDGELRYQCEQLVSAFVTRCSLPCAPVTFTGFLNQSRIVEAYVAADVLVLPSDAGETWGLVVNEAMACGRLAIVSDLVGCAQDLIENGRTGWTFSFGDWKQLEQLLLEARAVVGASSSFAEYQQRLLMHYSPATAAAGMVAAVQAMRLSKGV
jgi:glycosyltransferase involved in cell wall biosynthesis